MMGKMKYIVNRRLINYRYITTRDILKYNITLRFKL